MGEGKDQRGYLREQLDDIEIRLHSGERAFRLIEISLGGLALATEGPYQNDQKLLLDFPPFENVEVVVRSSREIDDAQFPGWSHRIGVQFCDPDKGVTYYSHAMDLYMDTLEDLPDEALDDLLS